MLSEWRWVGSGPGVLSAHRAVSNVSEEEQHAEGGCGMNAEMQLLLFGGKRNLQEHFSGKRPQCQKPLCLRGNMVETVKGK